MKQPRQFTHQHLAERMYALWLHLYPRAYREAYGTLMLQLFRDMCRDVRATQGKVSMALWLALTADETKSLAREYGSALREQRQRLTRPALAFTYSALLLSGAIVYIARCPH